MSGKIYFGISGWAYPDWEGIVYPKPRGFHPLELISQLVDAVEINSSFYAPVKENSARNWLRLIQNQPDFQFTAKLWQRFTHQQGDWSQEEVKIFQKGLEPIFQAGRLSCILIQFPWSFRESKENFERLKKLVKDFSHYPLVVEVRHLSWKKSWFLEWLKENQIGFANIDQPIFSGSLPPTEITTSRLGYVRLHGRNKEKWFEQEAESWERYDYLYSNQELLGWKERIERLRANCEQLFVIANNHFQGKGLVNALQLRFFFKKEVKKVPQSLLERYPQLKEICQSKEPQLRLF